MKNWAHASQSVLPPPHWNYSEGRKRKTTRWKLECREDGDNRLNRAKEIWRVRRPTPSSQGGTSGAGRTRRRLKTPFWRVCWARGTNPLKIRPHKFSKSHPPSSLCSEASSQQQRQPWSKRVQPVFGTQALIMTRQPRITTTQFLWPGGQTEKVTPIEDNTKRREHGRIKIQINTITNILMGQEKILHSRNTNKMTKKGIKRCC